MRLRNIPEAKDIVRRSSFAVSAPFPEDLTAADIFPRKAPLHMEIGMGKGTFLLGMAALHPEINYLGVERYETVLMRAVQKIEAMEAPPENARYLCADAALLPDLCPPGSVDALYLNFSDPWPKARHAKRRLTSGYFLSIYAQFLAPGAVLTFKTDNRDLFAFSLEEIRSAPQYELLTETRDLHRLLREHPEMENVMTEYERKFSNLGNKICRLTARFAGLTENTAVV